MGLGWRLNLSHQKNKIWIIFFLFFPVGVQAQSPSGHWKELQPGFLYQRISNQPIHFFKIDLTKYRFDLLMASDYGSSSLTADTYQKNSKALLVINGGFFDQAYHSLGLLYRRGQKVQSMRPTSWGIFLVRGQKSLQPLILRPQEWNPTDVMMAIQVGPRLVINGQLPSFKDISVARRSAVGITSTNEGGIGLSELGLTLQQWAELLKKECLNALNLDGGGSSQMSVQLSNFSLQVPGATAVPNALGVFEK